MRLAVVLAALVFALLARADDARLKVVGWADGGASFVYEIADDNGGIGGASIGKQLAIVLDVRTGAQTAFVLDEYDSTEDLDDAAEEARAKRLALQKTAYGAWLMAHPVKPAKASRTSPDGKLQADVQLAGNSSGAWKGPQFAYQGLQKKASSDAAALGYRDGAASLQIASAGAKRLSVATTWSGRAGTFDPYWSPDGTRIVWATFAKSGSQYSDPDVNDVLLGATSGATLEVLADKALSYESRLKVRAALGKAGLFPVRMGLALKARDRSVVYAQKGSEADAAKVAAAVPGGATVEPLTWKSECALVLALGSSAK